MSVREDILADLNNLKEILPLSLRLDELIRVPRRNLSSSELTKETTLSRSGLKDHLCCVICSGIIQNCVVIKTCLHRFCSNCIEKCFRSGIRECPQCRKHVPSKRFLRHDSIFDSIITTVLPNVKILNDINDALTLIQNKKLLLSKRNDVVDQKSFFQGNGFIKISDIDIIFDSKLSILDNSEIIRKLFHFKENCRTCSVDGISMDPFADNVCNCDYIRSLRGILSLLDDKKRQKEFREARKAVLESQPLSPPCGLTHFRLISKHCNSTGISVHFEFFSRSNITVRALNKFLIAKFANTIYKNHFNELTKYTTEEHPKPFSPRNTLAYIKNVSHVLPYDTLVLYYHTRP